MMESNELEIYLKVKDIFIPQEDIRNLCDLIERRLTKNKKRVGNFPFIQGGNHSDDVAIVRILAKKTRAKEGFDWDWGVDYDDYHFSIGFYFTDKGKKLLEMFEDYNGATLNYLKIKMEVTK